MEITALLNQKGVRSTVMRILVYRFLVNQKNAITLTDIEGAFEKSDRSTLYRTAKKFEEKGIVHQVDDGSGVPKYALGERNCNNEVHQDLHIHFRCTQCDETVCLTDYKIPQINLPDGYVADDVNIVVKGKCEMCSSNSF